MSRILVISTSLLIFHNIILSSQSNVPPNYSSIETIDRVMSEEDGEFILKLNDIEVCKGPKQYDCNNMTASIENGTNLLIYGHVTENFIPNRGKVEALMNNKPLLRLQMKKPCDHLFMKPLFQKILNVTQNCEFKKGRYKLNINIEDVAQRYYGGMFLYGTYSFKAVFYNDKCNFSCVKIEVIFSPKST